MCEEAAQFVEESLPGSSIRYTEDIDPDDELDLPGHAWVCWLGRAYDAEAPQGVASWRELPIFQAKLATDADAADDADDGSENELERTDPDEVVRLPAARSNPAARPLDKDLYADVVAEAKSRFDVWPSAYASGWVVKTYKARGGRYAGGDKKTRSGLTKWFGESWVDLSRPIHDEDGELVGYEPCGRKTAQDASNDPAAYPKCRPLKEAMRMSPSEVKDAIKRKRAAEAKAGRGGRGGRGARAPVRVSTYRANPPIEVGDVVSTNTGLTGVVRSFDGNTYTVTWFAGRGTGGGWRASDLTVVRDAATEKVRREKSAARKASDVHRALIARVRQAAGLPDWHSDEVDEEIARVSAAFDLAAYRATSREGAATPLGARAKIAIWSVVRGRENPDARESNPPTLKVVDTEEWDDGTVVEFVAVPFPYERKPLSYKDDPEVSGFVRVEDLIATQRRVTKVGVEKYLDDIAGRAGRAEKIRVYETHDGRRYIADGHHRAVAAQAAGVEVLPAVIQLVRE
jgi:hypothetical protein